MAKAANNGAGVLLGYGNYAGDVLHFTQAQERLRREGIDCRSIAVTDDVSSAPLAERQKRRGIAGDLTVFKVAAAAAEAGYDMDGTVEIAERANDRTRSFGVAFSGCTLPGAENPLFTVPEGRMAVGMGIHGEPGIDETDIPTADKLAELLVSKLLTEVPDGLSAQGARVVPILNGLGSVKYEELFVVYRRVAQLLAEAGLEAVDPQVGELVTSFDMAGTSLTLFWLDSELEELWNAPCDAPAFRRGAVSAAALEVFDGAEPADVVLPLPEATDESRAAAVRVLAALAAAKGAVDANVEELGRIDAIAGDGDHGIGMERGVRAAVEAATDAVKRGAGAASTLHLAADAWADRAGGTSGALWAWRCGPSGTRSGTATGPTAALSLPEWPGPPPRSWALARPRWATRPSWTCWFRSATPCPPPSAPGSPSPTPGARQPPWPSRPPRKPPTCCPSWAGPARTPRRASAPPTPAPCPWR